MSNCNCLRDDYAAHQEKLLFSGTIVVSLSVVEEIGQRCCASASRLRLKKTFLLNIHIEWVV